MSNTDNALIAQIRAAEGDAAADAAANLYARKHNERRITAAVSAMQTVLEDQQGDLPDRYAEWIDLYELADAALIAADEFRDA